MIAMNSTMQVGQGKIGIYDDKNESGIRFFMTPFLSNQKSAQFGNTPAAGSSSSVYKSINKKQSKPALNFITAQKHHQ
jgi:hypothetical protein